MCLLDKEVTIKFGNGSRSGCGNFGNEILRLHGTREIQHILLITQEVVNKFVYNSLRTGCLSLVTNRSILLLIQIAICFTSS